MRDVENDQFSREFLKQLPKGAFLNVNDQNGRTNIMTIGWGSIGFIWGRPVLSVMVRYSRHTYNLLEGAREFSVSVPLKNNLQKELSFCGSRSGRDVDKFKECGLTPLPGRILSTPLVKECDLFYECRIMGIQAIQPALLRREIIDSFYPDNNYHVFFHGEILAGYVKEE